MKSKAKIILILMIVMLITTCFVACSKKTTSLETPTNLAMNGSTFSWTAVSGASSYEIVVDSNDAIKTTELYYELNFTEYGSYIIKVRAVGKNEDNETIYSEYASITHIKTNQLSKPIVSVSGTTASWAAVEDAVSYSVTVLNTSDKELYTATITENSFSFDESSIEEADRVYSSVGKYTFKVVANPDETNDELVASDSGVAYYCVTKKLDTPAIVGVTSTSIKWGSISGITSYKIYLYKDGESDPVGEYSTTSNSYSISYLNFDTNGTYYCLIKAIGDTGANPVYLDSDISARSSNYDLKVLSQFNDNALSLVYDTVENKTYAVVNIYEIENISSFNLTLKATTASGSSSLSSIEKTISIKSAEWNCQLESTFAEGITYYTYVDAVYNEVASGTSFSTSETYYVYSGEEYVEAAGITEFATGVTYYTKVDAYYAKAYSTEYVEVADDTTYSGSTTYYVKVGDEYYTGYVEAPTSGTPNINLKYYTYDGSTYTPVSTVNTAVSYSDVQAGSSTTEYFKYENGKYTSIGCKEDSGFPTNLTSYYTKANWELDGTYYINYTANSRFEDDITYYTANKVTLTGFDSGINYYTFTSVQYKVALDDLFIKADGSYTKSDSTYYGKLYTVTLDATVASYVIVAPNSIDVETPYVSYKVPNKVDSSVAYDDSAIKGYFDTEADYNTFASTYNGYYYIESMGELQYMNYASSSNYVLLTDLDAKSYNWNPIYEFSGILDGNNHSITNLVIYHDVASAIRDDMRGTSDQTGLIGKLNSAGTVKNLYMISETANINTVQDMGAVGGIVGWNEGTISNCFVSGTISTYANNVGGITGTNNGGSIYFCQSMASIQGSRAGGITAINDGSINNCYATGDVTAVAEYILIGDISNLVIETITNSTDLYVYNTTTEVYDLLDKHYADADFIQTYSAYFIKEGTSYYSVGNYTQLGNAISTSISDKEIYVYTSSKSEYTSIGAFSEGAYISSNTYYDAYYYATAGIYAGGLVGSNYAGKTIENSFAAGSVKVNGESGAMAGGLVGENLGIISSCYSGLKYSNDANNRLSVIAEGQSSYAGGLVGYNSGAVSYSYSTNRATASDSFGGLVGYNDSTGTIEYCYSTGGVTSQSSLHKGACIGYSEGTITSVYYFNHFTSQEYNNSDLYAEKVASLTAIKTALENAESGMRFTTITSYSELCLVGVAYPAAFVDSITSSEIVDVDAYYAVYNMSTTSIEVTNLIEKGDIQIVIGDDSRKGTVVVVLQQEGNNLVAFLITVS